MSKRLSIELDHHGEEPILAEGAGSIDLIRAYNWFNYYYDSDDAKGFVLAYLKETKQKELSTRVSNVPAIQLRVIGWNCRMLSKGSSLPEETTENMWKTINSLLPPVKTEVEPVQDKTPVVAAPDRTSTKANDAIAYLEDQIDIFLNEGKNEFDASEWVTKQALKPQINKRIVDFYTPLYAELADALSGKDQELKAAYSHHKKSQLKKYLEFVKSIVSAADSQIVIAKTATKKTRKPRKKKVKPVAVLVSKLQYKEKDEELGVASVKPTDIVGAQQVWVFNTKNRLLSVFNALGETGLSVKGTTLLGYDEKTSIAKKLRKPADVLPKVNGSGKVLLRNLMKTIKTREIPAKGRLNSETIILRTVK
jgi:hypothetical protein